MNIITQEARYRQSLMKYAEKYGVSCASRKYNKARSYIYFWKSRWDGTEASLVNQSRRPHHHPNEHTPEECVHTDNGFEFTNKFSNSKKDIPTRFELTAKKLRDTAQAYSSIHSEAQRQG